MRVTRQGPQTFRLFVGATKVDVVARTLNDGGLLVQVSASFYLVCSIFKLLALSRALATVVLQPCQKSTGMPSS